MELHPARPEFSYHEKGTLVMNNRNLLALPLIAAAFAADAVEVAPRIEDREIIESLAELKAGQRALEAVMNERFDGVERRFQGVNERFEEVDRRFEEVGRRFETVDQRFEAVDQRFEAVDQRFEEMQNNIDQRFEGVNQRFDAMQTNIDQGFDAVDQRFSSMDQRFSSLEHTFDRRFTFLENLIMVVIAGIFGLIGYIVWDRKTALRPVETRLIRLESELHRDLELQHEEGSLLTRLVKVLREMARNDERLANVLRNFSLM